MRQPLSSMSPAEKEQAADALRTAYREHFDYVKSEEMVEVRGRPVQGLGLPQGVLAQFLQANAEAWYPGL